MSVLRAGPSSCGGCSCCRAQALERGLGTCGARASLPCGRRDLSGPGTEPVSGCLVSSASIQKLFCGSCWAFKWSFDEFVGEVSGLPVLFRCYLGTAPWFTIVNWLLLHPTAVKHRKTWWRKKQWTCPSRIWDFRLLSSQWEFYQHWFCSRFHHVKYLIHWHLTFFLTFVRYIWLRLFMLKIKIC